ncbi:winged helix-turn-helix domain-containing protein [Parachitinimonas caeni]|uniref:Winged helix-turn-helix domain-containing protein n=1 Tax=Parachitinimonas caeni TaxID=3031301 RepID=A0ABT7E0Z9_9NEIS|nr:winged helix-turn-helix domain-containing protein [Parachitinimonas caeni]MDK2125985.1 winged helix-turn-helix domain-containing protein [Parachitinimonas caeni]
MPDLPIMIDLPSQFQLGEWQVDVRQGTLTRTGESVSLPGLSLALLLALARRAGDLVEADVLMAEVWPNQIVTDETLQQRIKLLRKALQDSREAPRYIATVRGRGYRLLERPQALAVQRVAVEPMTAAPTAAIAQATAQVTAISRPRFWPSWRMGMMWLLAGVLLVLAWLSFRPADTREPDPRRLIVLPLTLLSSQTADQVVADGLTDQLIQNLAKTPGLQVIARTTAMSFKHRPRRVAELAAELGVGTVLEGSVRRRAQHLEVTLRLIDARNEQVRWSQRFDGDGRGLLLLEQNIAAEVAAVLGVRLASLPVGQTDEDAYRYYLEGRQRYMRYTAADNAAAQALFRASLVRSPAYALALAGLADATSQAVYQFGAPREQLAEALRYAEAAIAVAPGLAEAHKARGLALDLQGHRKLALESYRRASQLSPNYADALVNEAIVLRDAGRLAEAYQTARRASLLDPLDPYAYLISAQVLMGAGYLQQAGEVLNQVRRHAPDSAITQTIFCGYLVEAAELARAATECQWLTERHADYAPAWNQRGDLAMYRGERPAARTYYQRAAEMGKGDDAAYASLRLALLEPGRPSATLLAEVQSRAAMAPEDAERQYQLALTLAHGQQADAALMALERALALGFSERRALRVDPIWAEFQAQPRFRTLMATLERHLATERQKLAPLLKAGAG